MELESCLKIWNGLKKANEVFGAVERVVAEHGWPIETVCSR